MTEQCSCGFDIEWERSCGFPDVICPKCGKVYEMMYDESWDEETGEEEIIYYLESR